MMINNAIHSYQNIQYVSKPDANIAADSADGANNSLPLTAPTTVSVSDEAQQMRAKEREIASRYDVTNMSENEKIALSGELYESGIISFQQHAIMSFPHNQMISQAGFNGGDPDAKVNMLEKRESELAFALHQSRSTKEGIAIRKDEINILERMKFLRG